MQAALNSPVNGNNLLERLSPFLQQHQEEVRRLFHYYFSLKTPLLLTSNIWDQFNAFCKTQNAQILQNSPLSEILFITQEAIIEEPWAYLSVRPQVARWEYLRFDGENVQVDEIDASTFLRFKERLVDKSASEQWTLEIDLAPFNREFPKLQEAKSIGRGVEFLNSHLSSQLFQALGKGDKHLLDFLKIHQHKGISLMLNDKIRDVDTLRRALKHADEYLHAEEEDATWDDVSFFLQELGFECGWGRNVRLILEMLQLLSDILEAPEPNIIEDFLSRIPMIFSLAIISPHGFFGQANVLGLPDTGGQVVYILDQVRALEKELSNTLFEQGLDIKPRILVITRQIPEARGTTCDQRLEDIAGTEHASILRVPFRNSSGEIIPHWISRFEVWPYLERFSLEVEKELQVEMGTKPDLIVGNYSDGNLVATLLSNKLHVTQCTIAHALEKTKYLYSDLYWKDNEPRYHFSCQFTADLIAMNAADFIITSTYQEIAGHKESVGQYESYSSFTMPGLYRVVNGINIFDPKFNIVSPGADAKTYFPYNQSERRLSHMHDTFQEMLYAADYEASKGSIENKELPFLFTMARLDRIKNISGLVEWYAQHPQLRKEANLLVIAGHIDGNKSSDHEEQEQIAKMHKLFDDYNLTPHVRWLGIHLEKSMSGELYRYIADSKGVFVQPALFEAFGLTVIEAMSSGLPTFATRYGGPLEIIKDGVSGFHIDPNHGQTVADILTNFFQRCSKDPQYWDLISSESIKRVESHYTWGIYAKKMLSLSRIYGFWKYVSDLERRETSRYLEMLYSLQFRPLAEKIEKN